VTGVALYGAIGLALAVLLGMTVLLARMGGKAAAERDMARDKAKQAEKSNAIDEAVARLPDADLDRELRGRR